MPTYNTDVNAEEMAENINKINEIVDEITKKDNFSLNMTNLTLIVTKTVIKIAIKNNHDPEGLFDHMVNLIKPIIKLTALLYNIQEEKQTKQ